MRLSANATQLVKPTLGPPSDRLAQLSVVAKSALTGNGVQFLSGDSKAKARLDRLMDTAVKSAKRSPQVVTLSLRNTVFDQASFSHLIRTVRGDSTLGNRVFIDLQGAELRNIKLDNVNLGNINFSQARFTDGAELTNVVFKDATQYPHGKMDGVQLNGAKLWGSNFQGKSMKAANLSSSSLSRNDFSSTDLTRANLQLAKMNDTWFSNANLTNATLEAATINSSYFVEAKMLCANLSGSTINNSYFMKANLTSANLANARIHPSNVSFNEARVEGAVFYGVGPIEEGSFKHPATGATGAEGAVGLRLVLPSQRVVPAQRL